MERLEVIAFTKRGYELGKSLTDSLPDTKVTLHVKADELKESEEYLDTKVSDLVEECFENDREILFIGAAGIAVRMIAPFVSDKFSDIPVLVMDEWGDFVIPILSGHIGGANELAEYIADRVGAIPVITTATDANNVWAVDLFAKKNALKIGNRADIKSANSKILRGEPVTINADGEVFTLVPKEYTVGIGCKKGTDAHALSDFIEETIHSLNIGISDIFAIASIDLKEKEEAINMISKANHIPFMTFSEFELGEISGDFSDSDFVKDVTGVGNVCERAAICACGHNGGEIVIKKKAKDGMTIAIAKRYWRKGIEA